MNLSPVRSCDIQLSEFKINPSHEVGHDELVPMVEKNQEAALMGVQPKDPVRAAQLCFERVDLNFGAIRALLGNDRVFEEVARTLRQMKDSNDPVEEKKAVAVALAALASGQAMDVNSEDWPTAVRQVLRERQDTSEKYWREKKKKFELQKEKYPSVVIPTSHKPFFSADPRKLKGTFKFPVEIHGKSFSESHFVQALLDHSKVVLKELSVVNFSRLNLDHLEAGALKAFRGRAQTMTELMLFLLGRKAEPIRSIFELVIAGQSCVTRLDKEAATVLLKEIRFVCQQPKFLCCGPRVSFGRFREMVKADPVILDRFKQAEAALK